MSTTVGLDIGSYSIKAVVASTQGDHLNVLQAVEVSNPLGALLPDTPQKRDQMIEALKTMFEDNKLPKQGIRLGLAESLVSTKVVRMPLLSDAELASAIQWQVEQHIPIPLDQMQYEYTVLRRSEPKESEPTMDVLMIGSKKQVVESLAELFLDAELGVESLETDSLALLRVVETIQPSPENVAILQIGATSTSMLFVGDGLFRFVHVMPVAGALFTRAIERGVGLEPVRAEEYKRTYGLLPDQLEGKVQAALAPILDSLAAELQKAVRFYNTQHPQSPLQRIFVSGGSLYLPNILPTLSSVLNLELVPLELSTFPAFKFPDSVPQTSRFTVAIGLALKKKV